MIQSDMFNRFSEKHIGVILLASILAVSGCVYLPPLGHQFTEEKHAEIVVGKTTKDDVIKLLGEPNILKDRRFFVYEAQRSHGVIWATLFLYRFDEQHFHILLRFDDQNIVKRYEVESTKQGFFKGAVPVNLEEGPGRLNSELLLKAKGKNFLGFKTVIQFNSLALSSDERIMGAAGFKLDTGMPSSKKIWMKNLVTGELQVIDTPAYHKAVFTPDLTRVALINRTVRILDTKTGKTLLVYRGHGDSSFWNLHGASCLAFDQTGRFAASGGYQGNIRIWNTRTGKERISFKAHNNEVLSVAWSYDGRLLATAGSDGFVKLWKATTGEEIFKRKQDAGMLSFSPEGNILAINRRSHTELWKIKYNSNHDHQAPRMVLYNAFLLPYLGLNPYRDYIIPNSIDISISSLSLAWSFDGRLLAAGNGSGVVYNIEKGRKLLKLIPPYERCFWLPPGPFFHARSSVNTLTFSPDGKSIVTGGLEEIYRYPVFVSPE